MGVALSFTSVELEEPRERADLLLGFISFFEPAGPAQGAVPVPPAHVKPPLGMKSLDPFSWDIYCLGATLEVIVQV